MPGNSREHRRLKQDAIIKERRVPPAETPANP
jgi:hypothetical protein